MLENNLKNYYLNQLGIDCWVRRVESPEKQLQVLAQTASACTRCDLHKTRNHPVLLNAKTPVKIKLMILGETPGVEEPQSQGWAGKSGALLTSMLRAIGLSLQEVYFSSLVKCRPITNQRLTKCQLEACQEFLEQEIRLIAPLCILALGEETAQFLSQKTSGLDSLRSAVHTFARQSVVVSYHPDFLLSNPNYKKQAYQDLLFLKKCIAT